MPFYYTGEILVFGNYNNRAVRKITIIMVMIFKNWLMLSVRLLSYGCMWQVAKHARSVDVRAEYDSSFLSAYIVAISQVHP